MHKRKHDVVRGPQETQLAQAKMMKAESKQASHPTQVMPEIEMKMDVLEEKSEKSAIPLMKHRLFFSKSKSEALRRLSNFHMLDAKQPIIITQTMLQDAKLPLYEGKFASIEHFYQGLKFYCVVGTETIRAGARNISDKFRIDGEYGRDARVAKSKGGKGAMKAMGLSLDFTVWNRIQDIAMRLAISARATADPIYAYALKQSAKGSWLWLHFDRAGGKSYWGGHVAKETGQWKGRNRLGELMQEVGRSVN